MVTPSMYPPAPLLWKRKSSNNNKYKGIMILLYHFIALLSNLICFGGKTSICPRTGFRWHEFESHDWNAFLTSSEHLSFLPPPSLSYVLRRHWSGRSHLGPSVPHQYNMGWILRCTVGHHDADFPSPCMRVLAWWACLDGCVKANFLQEMDT